ncbi:MAG: hypothetical protein ABIO02_02360 [Patescibacteria group bacterium]
MNKIIQSIAVVFMFAAMLPNIQPEHMSNSFYAYFFYIIQVISQNYIFFILGFIVITVICIRFLRFENNNSRSKHVMLSTFQVVNAFIVGIFLSYVILLFVAFIHLNIVSIAVNINENMFGVISDKANVISTLKQGRFVPKVVTSDQDGNKGVIAIAQTTSGTETFYGKYVLSGIPKYFTLPLRKFNSGIILVDDRLIITQLNPSELQQVSPILSHLLVQKYFNQKAIRSYPHISLMGKKEYEVHRQQDYQDTLLKIDQEVVRFANQKSSTELSLEQTKNQLSSYSNLATSSNASNQTEYKQCLADGKVTLAYCKSLQTKWTDPKVQEEQIRELTQKIASDESTLKESEKYYIFYSTLGKSVKAQTGNIPYELGVFMPSDSIKIAFNSSNKNKTGDYFNTLVHEYLHYASYRPDNKKLNDSFFEEGLTEYFARKILKDELNLSMNLGYPIYVKIIDQISKRIAESDLEDIYFDKDQEKLEQTLDLVYGENFYKNTRLLFLNLQYTSDQKKSLQIANEIMEKIGGSPLNESDLNYSSSSL